MFERRLKRRNWLLSAASLTVAGPLTGLAARPARAATTPWPMWEQFKRSFMTRDGRIVSDDEKGGQTYSEGQAYALFFALAANDRPAFELLLQWTENNLCAGDLSTALPAWLWGQKPDGSWGPLDTNAASDADLWIVYLLAEAGRLWNDRRYRAMASVMGALLLDKETEDLPGLGPTLLPGPQGFKLGEGRWRLNPSYVPLQVLDRLAQALPQQPRWKALQASSLRLIVDSAPKGIAPDWVIYDAKQGFLKDPDKDKAQGAYNAIRVYLWAGMLHPEAASRAQVLAALRPMARLVHDTGRPPERIDPMSGESTGTAPSGFSAAMLPFLSAQGDEEAVRAQQTRLQEQPLRPTAYYEQCLALFGLGWMQQQYRFGRLGELQPKWTSRP